MRGNPWQGQMMFNKKKKLKARLLRFPVKTKGSAGNETNIKRS